jgi:hypothetical protein
VGAPAERFSVLGAVTDSAARLPLINGKVTLFIGGSAIAGSALRFMPDSWPK